MKMRQMGWVGLAGTVLLGACGGSADEEGLGSSAAALTTLAAPADRFFDGVDDRVTIPNHPKQQLGTGDFTVEVTVNFSSAPRWYEPLLSSRTSGTNGFLFVIYSNTLLLQMNGVPNFQSTALPNLADGKPHHLAVTRSGTTVTFYADGVARGSFTSARSMSSTGPMYIGYDRVDNRSLNGSFGAVRLWSAARSPAQLAQAAAGGPVDLSAPALVGAYSPNSALSQMVVDSSPLHNAGYLGTNPKSWDLQDPSWRNTATVELMSATATPTPPDGSGIRTTGDGPDLSICGALTINGVFDTFSAAKASSVEEATYNFFCETTKNHLEGAVDFAGSLSLPIEGVPIELEASNKSSASWEKVHSYCDQGATHVKRSEAEAFLYSTASSVIVDGFLACIDRLAPRQSPAVLQGSQSVSTDGKTIIFSLLANNLVNNQDPTVVVDTYVTGATCAGSVVTAGTTVPSAQAATATCTRYGDSPVSLVVVTTQGTYVFNAGGLGVIGTAWVTGAKSVETEDSREKCGNVFGVDARKCGLNNCKGDDSYREYTLTLDPPYTAFRNPRLVNIAEVDGNIIDEYVEIRDGGKTAFGSFKRRGRHSAKMQLCAEEYRKVTTLVDYEGPHVPVYGTKNFEVRVENAYEGKTIHVFTTDNNSLIQELDAAAYKAPFQLVNSAKDPLKTTYLLTLN